jgi:cytochrome c-type biogenesis protein CcmH
MLVFWFLAALMVVLALAFILVPLLRRPRASSGPSVVEANLDVLRSQRREIEADVATGVLPSDARDEALAELVERAHDDLAVAKPSAAPTARRPWLAAGVVAVALPVLAFGMYLAVGMPAAADAGLVAHEGQPLDDRQIAAMVDTLAEKVRDRPNDAVGWALLARSQAALGRFPEAVQAYEHVSSLAPNDANVLADWADALGMAQGRSLAGKPMELVKRALALDPAQPKALALAGSEALDAGRYPEALGYWERLRDVLAEGSEDRKQVDAVIAEVRQRAADAGRPLPEPATKLAKAAAPAPGATITGSVSVASDLASRVDRDATLYVFARAANGPRMPLAVVRASARELPLHFKLDDSQAMAPNLKLSKAEAVQIEARISRSGNATPQPGDLVGTSAIVKPGAQGVAIVVDKVLP